MSEVSVRQLRAGDAELYREVRLLALAESPEAFGSDLATEAASPVEAFAKTLDDGYVAGAFAGDRLVGMAGFHRLERTKMRHRGDIWGVYVAPTYRGSGVGRRVVQHVLDHARTLVIQVHLSVTVSNPAAVALYERMGFIRYGTEPRALMVDGRYLDEHLMVLRFT